MDLLSLVLHAVLIPNSHWRSLWLLLIMISSDLVLHPFLAASHMPTTMAVRAPMMNRAIMTLIRIRSRFGKPAKQLYFFPLGHVNPFFFSPILLLIDRR